MTDKTNSLASWVTDIEFERSRPLSRIFKTVLINPLANYLPASLLKALLRFGKSQLAEANWRNPGGWQSMVISYDGKPHQIADKILVSAGTMAMALRNRKRLGARLIARLIDESPSRPVEILCIGAGPGQIIIKALSEAHNDAHATLVDVNTEAFEFGRDLAVRNGLGDKVRFIAGDARNADDIEQMLERAPDVVKMLGICEYLTDEQIIAIARSAAKVMPPDAAIVFNSLSKAHRSDRFFRRVFGLHMNHRSPQELRRLMGSAGFTDFYSIPEPLGVYHVIVGRRRP